MVPVPPNSPAALVPAIYSDGTKRAKWSTLKDALGRRLCTWRVETVLPHVRGRLLDIGCGTNRLVRSYPGEGLGADVFQWGDVDIVAEDTAALPLDDESFDTVAIIAALNHIPNRGAVLTEANRVLRPGGRICITMIPPRLSTVWHLLRRPWDADQSEREMKPGEVYGLTPDEVDRLLSATGFGAVYSKRFMLGINRLTVACKP